MGRRLAPALAGLWDSLTVWGRCGGMGKGRYAELGCDPCWVVGMRIPRFEQRDRGTRRLRTHTGDRAADMVVGAWKDC